MPRGYKQVYAARLDSFLWDYSQNPQFQMAEGLASASAQEHELRSEPAHSELADEVGLVEDLWEGVCDFVEHAVVPKFDVGQLELNAAAFVVVEIFGQVRVRE